MRLRISYAAITRLQCQESNPGRETRAGTTAGLSTERSVICPFVFRVTWHLPTVSVKHRGKKESSEKMGRDKNESAESFLS